MVKTRPLLNKVLSHRSLDNISAITWGREHEQDAKDAFLKQEIGKHKHLKLRDVDLLMKKDIPYIRASPDALDMCDCCTKFVVECKCPLSIKDKGVLDTWQQTDFLTMDNGSITLKKSHKYHKRIQGQMALSKCSTGYFVIWTTVGEPLILVILFDPSFRQKVQQNLV